MGVIILCIVVAFMLWIFLAYHLNLVKNGFTTNESAKHSHYKHYLKMTSEFFAEWAEIREKDPERNPHGYPRGGSSLGEFAVSH